MRVSLADAADQLDDLVRRAEAGEEVILTQDGRAIVRLEPVAKAGTRPILDRPARTGTLAKFLLASPLGGADLQPTKDD